MHRPERESHPIRRVARAAPLFLGVLIPLLAGCSSNLDQVLFVGANAAARTAVDNWLTTLANTVAASFGN